MKKLILLLGVCLALVMCCAPKNVSTRTKLKDIVVEQPVRPMRIVIDTILTKNQVDSLYRTDSLGCMFSQKLFLPTYPDGCYYSQEIFIKYTDSITVKYSIDRHSGDSLYHVTKRIE